MACFILEILASLPYPHHSPCPEGSNCLHHPSVMEFSYEVQVCWYFPFLLEHFVTVNTDRFISLLYFYHFATELVCIPPIWQYFSQSSSQHCWQLLGMAFN